jgi:hypothetical protein
VLRNLGFYLFLKHGSTNFNTSKLANGVSCAHRCIVVGSRCNVDKKPTGKFD